MLTAEDAKIAEFSVAGVANCAVSELNVVHVHCNLMNATLQPPRIALIGKLAEIGEWLGPGLVVESIIAIDALANEPSALTSSEIFAVSPGPLLSFGDATE